MGQTANQNRKKEKGKRKKEKGKKKVIIGNAKYNVFLTFFYVIDANHCQTNEIATCSVECMVFN